MYPPAIPMHSVTVHTGVFNVLSFSILPSLRTHASSRSRSLFDWRQRRSLFAETVVVGTDIGRGKRLPLAFFRVVALDPSTPSPPPPCSSTSCGHRRHRSTCGFVLAAVAMATAVAVPKLDDRRRHGALLLMLLGTPRQSRGIHEFTRHGAEGEK